MFHACPPITSKLCAEDWMTFAHARSSISLNPLIYQPHRNFHQGAAMFIAFWVQLSLELLVCDRSVSVNVITHTFVGLECLTETKIQILCDHVDHTCFHIVEMGCQMVQLLSAYIVGPTMFVNLAPAFQMINNCHALRPLCKHKKFNPIYPALTTYNVCITFRNTTLKVNGVSQW